MLNKRFVAPSLVLLSIFSLALKKFGIPFSGIFVLLVFDCLIFYFFLKTFVVEKTGEEPRVRKINFTLSNLVFALCAFAILFRIQDWNGWQGFTLFAFVLLSVFSIFMMTNVRRYWKVLDKNERIKVFFTSYIPWIYFVVFVTFCAFANPRTFHNMINATTYEQFVREHFNEEEGMRLLELHKPTDASSQVQAKIYFDEGKKSEDKNEYEDALESYNLALDINPDDAPAYYRRGFIKLVKLELTLDGAQEAYDDFGRSIRLDSNFAMAYYHRAVALSFLDGTQKQKICDDMKQAVRLDSTLYKNHEVENFCGVDSARNYTLSPAN
jgi:tetratricopeptide (TPR) repeat protein